MSEAITLRDAIRSLTTFHALMKAEAIEVQLRTFMMNGTDPAEIEASANVAEEGYQALKRERGT